MDILTAKLGTNMAKTELAESGQIGTCETKTFTHDGNNEGKTVFTDTTGYRYARVGEAVGPSGCATAVPVYE